MAATKTERFERLTAAYVAILACILALGCMLAMGKQAEAMHYGIKATSYWGWYQSQTAQPVIFVSDADERFRVERKISNIRTIAESADHSRKVALQFGQTMQLANMLIAISIVFAALALLLFSDILVVMSVCLSSGALISYGYAAWPNQIGDMLYQWGV